MRMGRSDETVLHFVRRGAVSGLKTRQLGAVLSLSKGDPLPNAIGGAKFPGTPPSLSGRDIYGH